VAKLGKLFQSLRSVAGVVLVGLGLEGTTLSLGHFCRTVLREAPGVLLWIILAFLQASQVFSLEPCRLAEYLMEGLKAFLRFLLFLSGMV
jgi:hypothetical protein